MRHVIVFISFLCILITAQFIDTEFPYKCYPKDYYNYAAYLEYTCKSDGKSRRSECLNVGDQQYYNQSNVEVITYLCEHGLNLLKLYTEVFDPFKNVRVLDTSYLGINDITLIQSQSNFVSENKIARWKATNNRLTQIPVSSLDCMPNLFEIDFSHNEIFVLNLKKLEKANVKLLMVNCSHNFISIIDSGSLSTLPRLEILDLSHNRIAQIDEVAFGYNKHLKELRLGNNPLTKFSSKSISSLQNLEILDLSNTQIGQDNDGSFENNPKMKELNLIGTSLKKFSFNTFSPEADSIEVHLPSNKIEELDISCVNTVCHFKHFYEDDFFQNIRIFKAAANRDQDISKLLEKIGPSVESLDLSQNSIETLDDRMLENFTRLQHLILSHSNISKIENNAFLRQSNLILLDLSDNKLKNINNVVFSFHWTLKFLNLLGNQLTQLDKVTPNNLLKLESLKILKNPLDPVYLEDFLEQWKYRGVKIDAKMNTSFATQTVMTEAGRTTAASTTKPESQESI
ncbi:leucine-rich repeat-containing protein let-4-like [Sitodiplosis mosellana]|uniref:leucine-rich repeat-containing protein let-4-like n=1 Tax=Sitodiplosis mosellana TaxID=263140 RepID=UPI00244438CE|nr:leucine-rich repeat-containing protein let-4-like [Sitodiplosis mosellana]